MSEFTLGLEDLGVFGLRSEIELFFKKIDKDNDGRLKFSEFCDAFCPKDKIYADYLNNKRGNYGARIAEDSMHL